MSAPEFVIKDGMLKERVIQWLRRYRPDLVELGLERWVAEEMMKFKGQPAFGWDWHRWLEQAASDAAGRI